MNRTRTFLLGLLLPVFLVACDREDGAVSDTGIQQSRFPGQVSAGGGTSGEVMARNKGVADTPDPSGTPGIPQGAGGNTSGAAMGGTTGGQPGSTDAPVKEEKGAKPTDPAKGAAGGTPPREGR
jgi:hypothetical protein